jgi:uroporphyrinogen-III decarboxylase
MESTVKSISKLIGDDLDTKMKNKGITRMYIYKDCKICSEPTLLKILRGEIDNVVPLSKILEIYKAIGYNEIIIDSDLFTLKIK